MSNYSHFEIIGYLGRDAEAKPVNDKHVLEFSVAVSNKRGGNESTDWFDVVYWINGNQMWMLEALKKGALVHVSGTIRQETWQTQEGQNRSKIKFAANRVNPLRGAHEKKGQQQPAQPMHQVPQQAALQQPVTMHQVPQQQGIATQQFSDADMPF